MAVIASSATLTRFLRSRRGIATLVGLVIAAAVGLGILYTTGNLGGFSGSGTPSAIGAKIGQGFNRLESVAGMLAGRSPGERPEGELANLKHKRAAALRQRALPKIRRRGAAPNEIASVLAPPATGTEIAPSAVPPIFNGAGQPAAAGPLTSTASPEFPPVFPPPGGGFVVPPIIEVTPPVIPPVTPPVTPPGAVPEPSSWAMMLIGFSMIAAAVRRRAARKVCTAPQ